MMSHTRLVSALKMINVRATHTQTHTNTYALPTCPALDLTALSLSLSHTHTHTPRGATRVRLILGSRGNVSDPGEGEEGRGGRKEAEGWAITRK